MQEVVRIVKGLQLSDATHLMALPSWPHNKVIGDEVLVPASSVIAAGPFAAHPSGE